MKRYRRAREEHIRTLQGEGSDYVLNTSTLGLLHELSKAQVKQENSGSTGDTGKGEHEAIDRRRNVCLSWGIHLWVGSYGRMFWNLYTHLK